MPNPSERSAAVPLIETPRLRIRELTVGDAAFICDLLTQPSFLRFIGDRGVRTPAEAAVFIEQRYRQSYRDHGYGLYAVTLAATGEPMGICGFVRRDTLPCPDLGFAFRPAFEGHGYAFEAAAATLQFGREALRLPRVLAIVQHDNVRSHALLTRLGFRIADEQPAPAESGPLVVYGLDLLPPPPRDPTA